MTKSECIKGAVAKTKQFQHTLSLFAVICILLKLYDSSFIMYVCTLYRPSTMIQLYAIYFAMSIPFYNTVAIR